MTQILIVGAADTGRAPMAAALLQRLCRQRHLTWLVASAGVLGHDGDPPEAEARTAMSHLGLEITAHRARSASDELIEGATVIIAIDSGTAKALHSQFPAAAHIYSLGDLAKRQRDIPDPFRMQVGAWMTYARELDALLEQALPRIGELVGDDQPTTDDRRLTTEEQSPADNGQRTTDNGQRITDEPRSVALGRIERLLVVLEEMPDVVEWPAARARLERELVPASAPLEPLDLAAAYGGLLRAALALSTPTPGQTTALRTAFARLDRLIAQDDLTWLSLQIGAWSTL